MASQHAERMDRALAEASRWPGVVSVGVVDREGRVQVHTDPQRFGTALDVGSPRVDRQGRRRTVVAPIRTGPPEQGITWGHLVLVQDAPLRSPFEWLVVSLPALLGGGLALVLRRRERELQEALGALAPLLQAARAIQGGALDSPIPETEGDLKPLAGALTGLSEALAACHTQPAQPDPGAARKARLLAQENAELERINERLSRYVAGLADAARNDGLTGLANHRTFQEEIDRALRPGSGHATLTLLMLDVDHFKAYNDTHGHPAGDEVLKALARVLERSVRDHDLVARYGGEEFAVLLPGTGEGAGELVAQRIRASVAAHPFAAEHTQPLGQVTVSVGLATFPEDGITPSELIEVADQALYRAKAGGRNRVCRPLRPEEMLEE